MKNRIGNLVEIDWQNDLKPLQPENVKLPYNLDHLKKSLIKYGFSMPFYVWKCENEYLCLDGHTRVDVLSELIAEGHKVPKLLKAVEIEAKDRKEAISILTEIFNQKSNPFAEEYLIEWLETEEIEVTEINITSVNVVSEIIKEDDSEKENTLTEKAEIPTITVEYSSQGEKDKLLKVLRQFNFNYKIN